MEVVDDYAKTIYDELDLLREAANASQLRRNFEGSALLYVPQVYWDYCRSQVLVMERIYGVPVTDMAGLARQNTDMRQLAERGVEIFFTRVFRDSFFHADMHPGNIFVSTHQPRARSTSQWTSASSATLTPEDRDYGAQPDGLLQTRLPRWRSCTSTRVGYRRKPRSTSSKRRSVPSASRSSRSR